MSHDVALNGTSAFCILPSAFASGGFVPLFKVQGSRFEVQGSVFSISVPNTTALSRLPRRGLGALWTYPGTIDHPQSPIFKQASLSKSMTESSAPVPCAWRFAGGGHLKSRTGTSREKAQETQRGRAAAEGKPALT